MRKYIKYGITLFYKPLLSKYLSVTRSYTYKGLRLLIPPDVFHPGFFFSTKILLQYIDTLPLQQQSFLELGAGSGLISLYAAKKGACVTASDINPVAVEYLEKNRTFNKVTVRVIQSDLFNDIPLQVFDIIAINPPYYKKTPQSYIDHAWYCGENGEYFDRLFSRLQDYTDAQSQVLMILSDGCDLEMIGGFAGKHGWFMDCILTKKNMIETLFLYAIRRS
jgi:release factor glutamine methyltransferase